MFDQAALWETVQEVVRVVAFAAVSAGVSLLLQKLGVMDQSNVEVLAGTLVLKAVDNYIHEVKPKGINGLTDSKMLGL